ncbi:MAG: Smr/MutS family protein [Treponema sp.]|nr:Smr/MutS family protein [Treponema sp.]
MNSILNTQIASEQLLDELDFFKIRKEISLLASSEESSLEILNILPSADKEQISALKKMGSEWNSYLSTTRQNPVTDWPIVNDLFDILQVEGTQLLQEQIYALGLFASSVEKTRDAVTSASIELELPALLAKVNTMPSLENPKREIFSILDSGGKVKDLPQLREIRQNISRLHKEIENAIRKYTTDSTLSTALQSTVPAYRADRELLAVKSSFKNKINGIIHEVSSSGQTIFIEPLEIVKANNELLNEEERLASELRKIFLELTSKLSLYNDDFKQCYRTMILLDRTLAGAKWMKKISGIYSEHCDINFEPPRIVKARHPVLGEKAVPVDISFIGGKRVLIITGPNTGGKTVTLKTIALFALLNQSGFPVPAAEGTRLPIFNSIFADIGDEQSIAESLSTFSAHMKKMADMTLKADSNSLILLDELGNGTDPQEGSAIAMACLDQLIEKKAFVIVTTHHGVLKNYGYTNPLCINASVEFDSTNLKPTYKLLMGVPGESHAIDIALSAGLPEKVVEKAKTYISTQQADVSSLIQGLTQKHLELDEMLREENQKNAQLEIKAHKLHQREIRASEREIELKEAEHRSSSTFLTETRSRLENLVRQLREGEITREKTLSVKNFISELGIAVENQTEQIERAKANLEEEKTQAQNEEEKIAQNGMRLSKMRNGSRNSSSKKTKERLSNKEALKTATVNNIQKSHGENQKEKIQKPSLQLFAPGIEVLAGSQRRKGTLVEKQKNGSWTVQFGSIKMTVPQNQLMPCERPSILKADYILETGKIIRENDKPELELYLLGMRCEDALKSLERQIDLCLIHNFKSFGVVHGKGNGILQQAVQDFLSNNPLVQEFHFAPPQEGGFGKTYVTLI